MAQLNFNAAEVQPLEEFDAIPAGTYEAVITDSVMKPTKNGTGNYLELTVEIIAGDYKGRKLWSRLNLQNQSVKAVEIARRELSAICRATGVMNPGDSSELHNLPIMISVKTRKREDDGTVQNEISGWKAKEKPGATPTETANACASQETAPWKR